MILAQWHSSIAECWATDGTTVNGISKELDTVLFNKRRSLAPLGTKSSKELKRDNPVVVERLACKDRREEELLGRGK